MNILKRKRILAGMSKSEAARKTGISITSISRWEEKSAIPSPSKAKILCDAYGCEMEEIMSIYIQEMENAT
jgi:transcriptional regulator with XRE-family HTH domain